MLEFEWDDEKAERNLRKHAVSFDDAASAFADLNGIDYRDEVIDHEVRNLLLGLAGAELLAVAYTYRGERIRIISARKANRYEQQIYAKSRQD